MQVARWSCRSCVSGLEHSQEVENGCHTKRAFCKQDTTGSGKELDTSGLESAEVSHVKVGAVSVIVSALRYGGRAFTELKSQ